MKIESRIYDENAIGTKPGISLVDFFVFTIIFFRFCDPLNAVFSTKGVYLIYYGIYLLFLLIVFLNNTSFFVYFVKNTWQLFVIIFFITIRSVIAGNLAVGFYDPMKIVILIFNMIVAYSIYLYAEKKSAYFKSIIVKIALISLFISLVYSTYHIYFVDYLAVRDATMVDRGVGDFSLVYGVVFIPIICIINLKYFMSNKHLVNIGLIGLYIVASMFIIKASFMTALLLFLISTLLSVLIIEKTNAKRKIIFILGSIIILVSLFMLKEFIGNIIIFVSDANYFNQIINTKLNVIGDLLKGNADDLETFGMRLSKIEFTMQSFLSSPLIGINYSEYNADTIGEHAQWFDDLARFGIIGFAIWMSFFYTAYKKTLGRTHDLSSRKAIKLGWLIFMILGFLNPNTMSSITMILFVVIPYARFISNSKTKEVS